MMKERKNYFIETLCNFIIYDGCKFNFLKRSHKNLHFFLKEFQELIVNKQITRILIFN